MREKASTTSPTHAHGSQRRTSEPNRRTRTTTPRAGKVEQELTTAPQNVRRPSLCTSWKPNHPAASVSKQASYKPDKGNLFAFAVFMASVDHDVAGTSPAVEDASSGSDELSKEKPWDRIRALRTTAAFSPQHKDHSFAIASGFGRDSRGFLGVLNLALKRSELMKLAEKKQQELDVRRGVTEGVFHKGRSEPVLESKREAWHASFKSRRKQKVPANPAMLQALQTAHKIQENSFKEASEHQASLLLQGRFVSQEVPMDRKFNIRSRRLSGGQEIIQSTASLTQIWATKGTDDDKFRPENNAVRLMASDDFV